MLAKLLPYIKSQDSIPTPLMLKAFHMAADAMGSSKRRKIANEIMQGAGDYLPFWCLAQFISAELSEEKALELITEQRAFIERARYLVPALLSLLRVVDDSVLQSL